MLPDGTPDEIGFPLLVKAAAGGGGRGMRVVRSAAELDEALAAAEREAAGRVRRRHRSTASATSSARGTSRCSSSPTRTEPSSRSASATARCSGATRRCSRRLPRRGLAPELRRALHEAAVAFGRAIGYRSAGTVEFVLDGDEFFFLELNGRIQVEHPVTEAVTGIDLVARADPHRGGRAACDELSRARGPRGRGAPLRRGSADVPPAGRAHRAPRAAGTTAYGTPSGRRGVEEGDEIGLSYDPMIAKLIAHGRDRDEALDALAAALAETARRGRRHEPARSSAGSSRTPSSARARRRRRSSTEHPPLSAPSRCGEPPAPFRTPWRLNLPAPPPSAPPDVDLESHRHGPAHGESTVTAPMPGTVIRVEVAPGDDVQARQPLVVLEAMKMEIPVHSPFDGDGDGGARRAPATASPAEPLLVELES